MAKAVKTLPEVGKKYEHLLLQRTDAELIGRHSTPQNPTSPLQEELNELGMEGWVLTSMIVFASYIVLALVREVA